MIMEDLYPLALQCGVSPFDFWNLGIDEVNDLIDAFTKNKKNDVKIQITMMSVQVNQLVERLSLKENEEPLQLWDYYPSLFEYEKSLHIVQKEQDDLDKMIASRKAFAKIHNANLMNRGDANG